MARTKEERQASMAKARDVMKAKREAGKTLITQTAPMVNDALPASSPRGDIIPSNGNGHGQKPPGYENFNAEVNNPDIVGKTFSTAEVTSGLKLLGAPGQEIQDIPILADFPDRQYLIALARCIERARYYEDLPGLAELLYIGTGLCGIQGKRADMIVKAIIGDTSTTHGISGAWGKFKDKFKEKAGFNGGDGQ